jgi:hypothetical protein
LGFNAFEGALTLIGMGAFGGLAAD